MREREVPGRAAAMAIEPAPAEAAAVIDAHAAFRRLVALGWQEARYAPYDTLILLIEPGSTGIHLGERRHRPGAEGGWFWIHDGQTWPSTPMLWKAVGARLESEEAAS